MKRIYWTTTEWQHTNPKTVKMDIEKLSALDPIIEAEYSNIGEIVIIRSGISPMKIIIMAMVLMIQFMLLP